MLRLGMVGGGQEWIDVARRLRGASLDLAAQTADCDAVVLLTVAEGEVERLLAAGKHVLLANENVLTRERLIAWSALAHPGGPQLAVLNGDRFLPSRQLVRQQIDLHLGDPGLIRLHRWAAVLLPAHLLRDLDVVLWLAGAAPRVVYAVDREGDLLQVHLGFAGGGMALIAHAAGPPVAAGYFSLSVIASAGAAYADDQANRQLHFTNNAVHALRASDNAVTLTAIVQFFIDALVAGTDLWAGLTTWHRVLAVRAAIANSLVGGRAIHLENP